MVNENSAPDGDESENTAPAGDTKKAATDSDAENTTQLPKISIDDFKKVEITVGRIVSAEKVAGADKLLRLEVDFGSEMGTRQIVSGIAEFFSPEEIIGKKCPFVTNLEPRVIRGLESDGMIMAASAEVDGADGETGETGENSSARKLSLLNIDDNIPAGACIS